MPHYTELFKNVLLNEKFNLQKLRQPRLLRHIWSDQGDAIKEVQLYITAYSSRYTDYRYGMGLKYYM